MLSRIPSFSHSRANPNRTKVVCGCTRSRYPSSNGVGAHPRVVGRRRDETFLDYLKHRGKRPVFKPPNSLCISRSAAIAAASNFRLLRHLRVKLEEEPLAQVVAILDPDDVGSFSLERLLEAALSTVEEKQVRFSPPRFTSSILGHTRRHSKLLAETAMSQMLALARARPPSSSLGTLSKISRTSSCPVWVGNTDRDLDDFPSRHCQRTLAVSSIRSLVDKSAVASIHPVVVSRSPRFTPPSAIKFSSPAAIARTPDKRRPRAPRSRRLWPSWSTRSRRVCLSRGT